MGLDILEDGFKCSIAFALVPSGKFEIKGIKPPGVDSGGKIDTTTHSNTRFRTGAGKELVDITDCTMRIAFATMLAPQMLAAAGKNQLITFTDPVGATCAFYGVVDKFEPGDYVEGEQPEADVTIFATNRNGAGVETGPVWTAGTAGTSTTTTPAP